MKIPNRSKHYSFGGAVCAGVVLLMASSEQAQNLFVADQNNGVIYDLAPGGAQVFANNVLSSPTALAFDSAGNLFVSDHESIYEYTPGGVESTFASGLVDAQGLAFNSAGDLFAADTDTGNIYEYTPGGVRSTFASGLGGSDGLAFNSAGDLFASAGNHIYEFTPGGARSTFASGLSVALGLAFNSAGDLFEADFGSLKINEFTPGGVESTFASGLFLSPEALAIDSTGDLFVGEIYGSGGTITEFTPGGTPVFDYSPGVELGSSCGLAFQPQSVTDESSTLGLLGIGATALLVRRLKLTV